MWFMRLGAIALMMVSVAAFAEAPVVTVERGALSGYREDGLYIFKGIPYAKPPVGDRRWTAPEPVVAWQGVQEAREFGASCVQPPMPPQSIYADEPEHMSEDCLTLNIWAPEEASGAPVIVWIYGGALQRGSSASPMYDGAAFAKRGVVFVSINYRLGLFGWLAHPALSAESPHGVSGNYGLLDQIAALTWVKRNIAAFGGDAGNVTVMGESAGALSVTYLLTSPLARGSFDKAILESPNIRAVPDLKASVYGNPSAEDYGVSIMEKVGASSLADLRAMDARALALKGLKARFWAQGTIDHWSLTAQVVDVLDAGVQAKVPTLAGFNRGEIRSQTAFLPAVPESAEAYVQRITERYGDLASAFLKLYPSSEMRESMLATLRDAIYGWATERIVRAQAASGVPAYQYIFDHCDPATSVRALCAFHASELPYVFGQVGEGAKLPANWPKPAGEAAAAMSDAMMDYWVSFVRTGVPVSEDNPDWRPYRAGESYMLFAERPMAAQDPVPGMFEMQDELVNRRRAHGQQWFINVGLMASPVPSQ